MKKVILPIFLAIASMSFGQKITADLNLGAHAGSGVSTGVTGNIGVAYKISPLFSARLDAGLDQFGDNNMNRLSGHVVVNLSDLMAKSKTLFGDSKLLSQSNYGLSAHVGVGVSNRVNDLLFNDDYRMTGDGMVNTMIGLTPSYKLNDKMSIQLDASYILLMKSDTDMGSYLNTTVGIAYKF
jgi:hypothetical protein